MPVIQRYLFRMAAVATLAALFGWTGVIWMTEALRDFDLLTSKGQSILMFLSVTAMVLPSLVMVIAPVALFAAIVFALNKLNTDSELISMTASGMSPWQIMRPFAALTLLTACFVGMMSLWLMPWGFINLRNLLTKVRADFLANIVVEGQFTTLDRGFVFHYRERAPGHGLRGIFIQDRRDPEHINTYLAEAGYTIEENGQSFLRLEKGSIQRQQQGSKDPIMVVFDTYAIDLAQFSSSVDGSPLRPRERTTWQLLFPDTTEPFVQQNPGAIRSELHDRLVNPLFAVVFGAIAFAAVGRVRTTRQGRGFAILFAVIGALAIRLLGVVATALVANHASALIFQYLLPLLSVVIAVWYALGDPRAVLLRLAAMPPLRIQRVRP